MIWHSYFLKAVLIFGLFLSAELTWLFWTVHRVEKARYREYRFGEVRKWND